MKYILEYKTNETIEIQELGWYFRKDNPDKRMETEITTLGKLKAMMSTPNISIRITFNDGSIFYTSDGIADEMGGNTQADRFLIECIDRGKELYEMIVKYWKKSKLVEYKKESKVTIKELEREIDRIEYKLLSGNWSNVVYWFIFKDNSVLKFFMENREVADFSEKYITDINKKIIQENIEETNAYKMMSILREKSYDDLEEYLIIRMQSDDDGEINIINLDERVKE